MYAVGKDDLRYYVSMVLEDRGFVNLQKRALLLPL